MSLIDFLHKMTSFSESILFFEIFHVPFIVLWLGVAGIVITIRMKFLNVCQIKHAINILRGKYASDTLRYEVTPFQALMSSMAATIGTGSIVGVAVAISIGGPGAVIWMMIFGFLGMTVKCVEVYLGHKYRIIDKSGEVLGGPFIYLKQGLADIGLPKVGVFLSMGFLICGFVGVLGISGFQSNQVVSAMIGTTNDISLNKIITSVVVTIFCAYIFFGGVKRLSAFADKIVPFMVVLYVGMVVFIIINNPSDVVTAFKIIWFDAFDLSAGVGGFFAMVAMGARRALFACEAGQGTSPIVNATSNVKFSQRQGIINLLDPFITTWIVCLSSAIVIVMAGLYTNVEHKGVTLVNVSFSKYGSLFIYIVTISIMFFALTTLTTDTYYFDRIIRSLKINNRLGMSIFFIFIFISGVVQLDTIVAFADVFVLLMAVFNIIGLYFLINKVAREFDDYLINHKEES